MNLKKSIKNNLFFKVDFDGRFKKTKKGIVQVVRFFLIGSVPVVVEYEDGGKERSIINALIETKQDPYLRMLHGAKFSFLPQIKKEIKKKFKIDIDYKDIAEKIIDKQFLALQKVIDEGKFMGKKIKSIYIINIGEQEYDKSKNNKKENGGTQTRRIQPPQNR